MQQQKFGVRQKGKVKEYKKTGIRRSSKNFLRETMTQDSCEAKMMLLQVVKKEFRNMF